jgi:hypothetical protein
MEQEQSASLSNEELEPSGSGQTEEQRPTITNSPDDDPLGDFISILLRDGLDQPIANLQVKVDVPGAQPVEAKTDAKGAVVIPLPPQKEGQASLSVKDAQGKHQEVGKIDIAKCDGAVVVRSPKVKASVPLQPHQQTAPQKTATTNTPDAPDAPWYATNGALGKAWEWFKKESHPNDQQPPAPQSIQEPHVVKQTVNKNNNPVIAVVGPECPNKDNLKLGGNNIYRTEIINAGKRVGLIPQAIAALIGAEAAKIIEHTPVLNPDGSPKIYTNGKKKGQPVTTPGAQHWNARSYNSDTNAAGLTQFLATTWLGHALLPGYFVHEQSVVKGWVKNVPDAKGRAHWVFVLSDGKTTDKPTKTWILAHANDANVKACLDQRFIPEWSIMAAADYGKANLDVLSKKGFKLQGLNDAEKAKLMYLMHHEGEGAGPLVINNELNKIPEAQLRSTFVAQLGGVKGGGEERARLLIQKENGDVARAYRNWIGKYIDDQIDVSKSCCDQTKSPQARGIFVIFEAIGGKGK